VLNLRYFDDRFALQRQAELLRRAEQKRLIQALRQQTPAAKARPASGQRRGWSLWIPRSELPRVW